MSGGECVYLSRIKFQHITARRNNTSYAYTHLYGAREALLGSGRSARWCHKDAPAELQTKVRTASQLMRIHLNQFFLIGDTSCGIKGFYGSQIHVELKCKSPQKFCQGQPRMCQICLISSTIRTISTPIMLIPASTSENSDVCLPKPAARRPNLQFSKG